eukprot:8689710-Pyramimonas_sp.AAC.1
MGSSRSTSSRDQTCECEVCVASRGTEVGEVQGGYVERGWRGLCSGLRDSQLRGPAFPQEEGNVAAGPTDGFGGD